MHRLPERSWLDPRLEVRPSPIEGLGLFARAPIRAGEVVIRWGGTIAPVSELENLIRRERYDCAALTEDSMIVFDEGDPVIHGNHSCDPNLWMAGQLEISARRDIAPGEEATIDYATMSDSAHWLMPCSCGTASCRGAVRGDDWSIPELQERYRGHFMPYLEERFRGR